MDLDLKKWPKNKKFRITWMIKKEIVLDAPTEKAAVRQLTLGKDCVKDGNYVDGSLDILGVIEE